MPRSSSRRRAVAMIVEQLYVHGAFAIRQADSTDFTELVALRRLEDWAPNAWLFDAVQASGLGNILLAREQTELIGQQELGSDTPSSTILASAVAMSYGAFGIIGNVIVHASHRARGLGRAVMEAELAWLRQRGVHSVELDATEHGRPLYEKLGFVPRAPSWMLVERAGSITAPRSPTGTAEAAILELSPGSLEVVAALDWHAFGGDRMPLLSAVLALRQTRGWAARDVAGTVTGYIFVRPLEHPRAGMRVGPWIAQSPEVALGLLRHATASPPFAALGDASVLASVPGASNVVTGCFRDAGMSLVPDDVRMRLTLDAAGAAIAAESVRADWVYGMLAPMVG